MAVPNPLHILLHVFDLPFVSTTANFHFHLVTEIDRSRNAAAMGRAPCCDKAAVKRGSWSAEEDAKLKSYIEQHGTGGNWISLPQKIGLKRCGKSCRLRWLNYLRPNIKHGKFSEEEDDVISRLYFTIGSRWSVIAAQLPGRTDNDVKNHWNTRLKKKLHLGKQQNRHWRRQALPRRAGEPCSQDEAGIRSHYETQPPPSGVSFSSSCPSAPAPASTSHAEASESSNGFLEPLNDYTLIPFESTELGEMDCLYGVAGMDWNETSPFMCLNQQAEGSHGMLHLQHQFAEPAMHLIQRAPR